jgi:hypothetical protein
MRRSNLTRLALLCLAFFPLAASAEPYFAARMGMKCVQCHTNPTGGGLRNVYGNAFAQTTLAASRLKGADADLWTGLLSPHIALGGNVRASYGQVEVPDARTTGEFDVDEGRLFVDAAIIPGRLSVYLDQRVAPGNAESLEANVRYWIREDTFYVKAGRMYLPFGWRLEDDNAYTRQLSGTGMTVPDDGAEVGLESGPWSVQLALSNGTGGGPEQDSGKQAALRAEFVRPVWRIGASALSNDTDLGDRKGIAVHGALRTGPVVWLGELDYFDDDSLGLGGRKLGAALAEANWLLRAGTNLKLTFEHFEPDDEVDEDEQDRYSLVLEHVPFEFLQLRLGARVYDGIPQSPLQNRRQYFLQLNGFF